jgi:hypothetical protein
MVTTRQRPFRFADMVTARRTRGLRLCVTLCVLALGMAGRGLVEPAMAQARIVYVIPIAIRWSWACCAMPLHTAWTSRSCGRHIPPSLNGRSTAPGSSPGSPCRSTGSW